VLYFIRDGEWLSQCHMPTHDYTSATQRGGGAILCHVSRGVFFLPLFFLFLVINLLFNY
jgi:hypothetical protein